MHERKMDLMRRKLERNEERLRQLGKNEHTKNAGDGSAPN